jgi:hypothetical protein
MGLRRHSFRFAHRKLTYASLSAASLWSLSIQRSLVQKLAIPFNRPVVSYLGVPQLYLWDSGGIAVHYWTTLKNHSPGVPARGLAIILFRIVQY